LAVVYLLAGVAHLKTPDFFLAITPSWVPMPRDVIFVTGICEILGAAALLGTRWRYWAGIMLAAYAVCVYPANIKHWLDDNLVTGAHLGLGYHIPRLLFQPIFVWWALYAGEVISWPFKQKNR
jgi:uncharacterized membrane protein